MGVEIERRFLALPNRLPRHLAGGARIVQGYLSFRPLVRVRLLKSPGSGRWTGRLTVKGPGLRTRAEFEYAIPAADARALVKLCGRFRLEKVRARIGPWEVDRYTGRHAGLWLAEIELPRAHTPLPRPRPPWLGREVTGDPRYTNSRLARCKARPPWWH